MLHVPVWLRVLDTTPRADVLLVDDDGSSADPGFPDYSDGLQEHVRRRSASPTTTSTCGTQGFLPLLELYHYKAVVIFTGNNDSFDTSGFFPADQNAISEWLDSGGKLWTTGQNFAEETDSDSSFSSPNFGRSRLYHGYLGLEVPDGQRLRHRRRRRGTRPRARAR